jgi:hypothetical protein
LAVRVWADFRVARAVESGLDPVVQRRAARDLAGPERGREREALPRREVEAGKLRAKPLAEVVEDLTHRVAGEMRLRACEEEAGQHGAIWVRWPLKPG